MKDITDYIIRSTVDKNGVVKVWEENIVLPTYGVGMPEKNPMFFEKRVYQGSSGAVYPYPVIEKIEDICEEKPYKAVFLENEYIKVMILPELGGRIQMAWDKIKARHFIYFNRVVKPALVGLTGPWISGGIEFNWPQHHRPSTYMPVDYSFEECADGSAVVWVGERERMFHQKGMAGFVLRPGRAVLEIQGKLYNPTPVPQTFLWWANPAVKVNDHYQSVFPADVNAVFDHGKRDVSEYPIAKGVYYKMDYSAGVDISRYKNIPVPTSYMAVKSGYDFVGGYENDTRAGVLHVASHHISPGKKQWTWGNGDFGRAWDRNLTDEDGPYIELMTGVYTDNQPDFSWLGPYEEKSFTQYFIPYRELGVVKNASADLLMNIEPEGGRSVLKIFATSRRERLSIVVRRDGRVIYEDCSDMAPESVYEAVVPAGTLSGISVSITSQTGECLLAWESEPEGVKPIPDPARAALDPPDVASTEQLFLTGQHLEQYRHATYDPSDYYAEALRRDPGDIRNNNAMGLWLIRKGQFARAETYLRRAVATMTERNPNPYDGEPLYNLGLSLKYQGMDAEAYDCFYKATWNAAWQDAGYYSLAQISTSRGDLRTALEEIEKSFARNWHNHRARHLKATLLRRAGRAEEARTVIGESLLLDRFNTGCRFEAWLLAGDPHELDVFHKYMRGESHNYAELAIDYTSAGCWEEAVAVLDDAIATGAADIMTLYYKAWCLSRMDMNTEAVRMVETAEKHDPGCCFPNRPEAILALQTAMALVDHTPVAAYLLGNLWYDKRQYPEAVASWERSLEKDGTFPTVQRNLALACFNKLGRREEAVRLLEKAFDLDTSDARVLMELDQLYKKLNRPHSERLALLEEHRGVVWQRDDLYLEYVTLLNQLGRYTEAIALIGERKFHPWEGGEGKVPAQYQIARVELAKQAFAAGEYGQAVSLLDECYYYPDNFGEGKLPGAQENDFDYYKGCALQILGRHEEARDCFERASLGISEPSTAMYYNDPKPDKIFYQGLALRKLGREEDARSRFDDLVSYGKKHLSDKFKTDYFAVSIPDLQIWEDDMDRKNTVHCHYLMGLGYLGLEDKRKAESCFAAAAEIDNNHQGVQVHRKQMGNM